MAGIEANLTDLQSGIEACSRAADALCAHTERFDDLLKRVENVSLGGPLLRYASELQACAHDQRGVLLDLRERIQRLQRELRGPGASNAEASSMASDRPRL